MQLQGKEKTKTFEKENLVGKDGKAVKLYSN